MASVLVSICVYGGRRTWGHLSSQEEPDKKYFMKKHTALQKRFLHHLNLYETKKKAMARGVNELLSDSDEELSCKDIQYTAYFTKII